MKNLNMFFEFVQIPLNDQGSAKKEANNFLRGWHIASMRKELDPRSECFFWAYYPPREQSDGLKQQHRIPVRSEPGSLRAIWPPLEQGVEPTTVQLVQTQEVLTGAGKPAEAGSKAPSGSAANHFPVRLSLFDL
jgi:hypothetical protein